MTTEELIARLELLPITGVNHPINDAIQRLRELEDKSYADEFLKSSLAGRIQDLEARALPELPDGFRLYALQSVWRGGASEFQADVIECQHWMDAAERDPKVITDFGPTPAAAINNALAKIKEGRDA